MTDLYSIAQKMVALNKGILAADESNATAAKRLASIQMESTPENRRQYRELFLGTQGIENALSGVILYDETIRQNLSDGTPFVKHLESIGVLPGIKVDMGLKDMPGFPGEKISVGLDTLDTRLQEYYAMGARFAKWRSVIAIGPNLPTEACIKANAMVMALYAGFCQAANIVPMIEPEVLLDGDHDLQRAEEVTTRTLELCFEAAREYHVDLKGLILKSSMVIPGNKCADQSSPEQIAEATIRCLKKTVPAEVPGIVFLSGGQTAEQATDNLRAINQAAQKSGNAPWQLTFSYARALQGPPLAIWAGKPENLPKAREVFTERLTANSKARMALT